MYHSIKKSCKRLKKELSEIAPYIVKTRKKLNEWKFTNSPSEKPPIDGWMDISTGYRWDEKTFPVWFRSYFRIEVIDRNDRLFADISPGGESLVLIDGKPFGEINVFHKQLDISNFADNNSHSMEIQTVPRELLGKPVHNPSFEKAELLIVDNFILETYLDFLVAIETLETIQDSLLIDKMFRIISNSLARIEVPRSTDEYFKNALDNPSFINNDNYGNVTEIWDSPVFSKSCGNRLPQKYRDSIEKSRNKLNEAIKKLKTKHFIPGTIKVAGQAHLDYAWLWPISETKRKIRRTFSNALRLIDKFPEFIFIQTSAQMYKDLKEIDKELFERVKDKVMQGKLEAIGGMWVESDCSIASAESIARQFLYGQRFFKQEFGITSTVAWLPDVFGFSWILPQILRDAGIKYFTTTKLKWNEKNRFPFNVFIWKGLDGTDITSHFFDNPLGGYNGMLNPEAISKTWENHQNKSLYDKTLMTVGYGDGGGGPTDEMIEYYERLKDYPGLPCLEMSSLREYFEELPPKTVLPIWDDELYFELHRGTYTSQSRTKTLHKTAEDTLYKLEMIGTFLIKREDYPLDRIRELWEIVLHNEFHDILPGSAINEVHRKSERELSNVIDKANQITNDYLKVWSDGNHNLKTVFNISSFKKKIRLIDDDMKKLRKMDGTVLVSQKTYDGKSVYANNTYITPFSLEVLQRSDEFVEKFELEENTALENKDLLVEVNDNGSIYILDKKLDRQIFTEAGNLLYVYKDIPVEWDAWDIDYDYERSKKRLFANSVKTIECGPVRKVVQVKYSYEGSKITQRYILYNNSRRLDIETELDWHTRRTLLKAHFPLNILTRKIKCDLSAGYTTRDTRIRNEFDKARFEFVAHRWVELSEPGFGVSILNDGKYGHACNNSNVSLTLLKSAVFPDFFADEGKHKFTYSVFSHNGNNIMETIMEAENFNKKLVTIAGKLDIKSTLMEINAENLKVLTLKHCEQSGFVLRLAEVEGKRGKATIKIALPIKKAWKSNILEEKKEEISLKDGKLEIEFRPFGIHTIRFE